MRDRADFMLAENLVDERRIAKIADNEFRGGMHGGTKAGRKIIEDDHVFARIEKR